MSPEQEPSNATLLAKLEGLETLIKLSVGNLEDKYATVTHLPVKVAALEADLKAVQKDVAEIREDTDSGKSRLVQWVSMTLVTFIGIATVILYVIQAAHR